MGKNFDELAARMKGYEKNSSTTLSADQPVIIRIDGKAFHTFTKGLRKPFDQILTEAMQQTMLYLCQNVQNCVFGYTQSDEITLVLVTDKSDKTDPWFGNNTQKMCSVAASMATVAFNKAFYEFTDDFLAMQAEAWNSSDADIKYGGHLETKLFAATFDARAFNIPKEDVINNLIWRQKDAIRNSIMATGRAYFSHKQLHGKSSQDVVAMLQEKKTLRWEDVPLRNQRGSCCYRQPTVDRISDPRNPDQMITVNRNPWVIDHSIPLFVDDRNYVEVHLGNG